MKDVLDEEFPLDFVLYLSASQKEYEVVEWLVAQDKPVRCHSPEVMQTVVFALGQFVEYLTDDRVVANHILDFFIELTLSHQKQHAGCHLDFFVYRHRKRQHVVSGD
jgi:hypothetical protein